MVNSAALARSPAAIDDMLAGADIVTLLMVLVTFTHDETLLETAAPYIKGPWDYSARLPESLQQRIRDELREILREYYGGSRTYPPKPPLDLMMKMMSTSVGESVPLEYVPMILEEMGFADETARSLTLRRSTPQLSKDYRVVIIGAGISGICAGIKLREAGIPFVVYEKNGHVGGTWYENSYPGCAVDTPNHFYSFSFEPNHDWSHYFSKRDELYSYLNHCVDKYELREHIRFNKEVKRAVFDEDAAQWQIEIDGQQESVCCKVLIFAVGQLNRPFIPAIPGIEEFAGPILHTAQWDSSKSYRDKRVALIGAGASAVQVGPSIAPDVRHLTIFQRSPHWVSPSPNYHRKVGERKKQALKQIPYYSSWYRFQLLWGSADGIYPSLRVDPSWDKPEQSLNEKNHQRRLELIDHIKSVIGERPELLAKIVPPYPPYGKRMLRDNNWYQTLLRENVSLVTAPIDHITSNAIVTKDGEQHEAEFLVMATGFQAARMLAPMDIVGRDGTSLRDIWGEEDPRAFLGITVPKFPNMFILFGPNTVLAHGGSAIFHTESQVRYTLSCLREMIEGGFDQMECRTDVHDAYNVRVDEIHGNMVWAHSGVSSWYKNSRGRVVMTTPWRMVDYWRLTSDINPSDYEFKALAAKGSEKESFRTK